MVAPVGVRSEAKDGNGADAGRTRAAEGKACRQFFAPEIGRIHFRFRKNGDTINYCGLTFSELAHNIESTERQIYVTKTPSQLSVKDFRHDCPQERRNVVNQITSTWADVMSVSAMLDLNMDSSFMQSALSLYSSVDLDGYDLFMAEVALRAGVTQIVTDDSDYATVPGLTVFTANIKVIGNAQAAGMLIRR